jgi:hypothetical protein
VIGIPIAVVLAMSYLVLFYTSTLVVAYFAGFLAPARLHFHPVLRLHPVLRTALSLLALSFLVELPWVGAGLNFSIRVFGMGCIAVHLHQLYAARRLEAPRSSPA